MGVPPNHPFERELLYEQSMTGVPSLMETHDWGKNHPASSEAKEAVKMAAQTQNMTLGFRRCAMIGEKKYNIFLVVKIC